jgi:hypothetical protein
LSATVDTTAISSFWDQATIELATVGTVSIASINTGRKGDLTTVALAIAIFSSFTATPMAGSWIRG